jgi:SAM-dependent methyltransferase
MDRIDPRKTGEAVLAHHRAAAAVWDQGGGAYDEISFGLSDAIKHAVQRLNAKPEDIVLDVATGTGWTARGAAPAGARVTGVDISAALLEAAQALSAHIRPRIAFERADAERLPFADGSFDGVISTFGVIFAQNQERAAAELGRVCRKGGRLVLAVWAPKGSVADLFTVMGRHTSAAPPPVSSLAWGDPARAEALLGGDFTLTFETGINHAYYDDEHDIWARYIEGFGPLRALVESLDAEKRAALKRDHDAYHRQFAVPAGLHVQREYLVIAGRRR